MSNGQNRLNRQPKVMGLLLPANSVGCIRSFSSPLKEKGNMSKRIQINSSQMLKHLNFFKDSAFSAPAVLGVVLAIPLLCSPVVQAADTQKAATLFSRSCIGCHDGGGNIIQPGATLFLNDLQRNGVDTEDEIYRLTYFGKGRMPGFGEKCTPRGQCTFGPRLQDYEIKLLSEFVKLQADQGWPSIEISEDLPVSK